MNMKNPEIIKTSKQKNILDDCLHEFIFEGEKSNKFEIISKIQ